MPAIHRHWKWKKGSADNLKGDTRKDNTHECIPIRAPPVNKRFSGAWIRPPRSYSRVGCSMPFIRE